jgi:hypothetical protein
MTTTDRSTWLEHLSPARCWELRRARDLPLRYWSLGDKDHWIRIVLTEVTGRRLGRGADRA